MQYTHKMVDDQLNDNAYKIIMKILSQYLIIASMYYIFIIRRDFMSFQP